MSELKAPALGTTLGERYTLLRFLGQGAMGAVYEAATPSDERVAVKVLLELGQHKMASELERRFVREAAVASTFASKHVVPVVDSGMDEALGVPYLVMPLLVGSDASTLLGRTGALHPTVAVRMVAQACAGLMEAHKQQVVHRDVKPDNLFLDQDDEGNVTVRVLDFGMAKLTEESGDDNQALTRAGSILGTPHYMSPEQSMNAKDVDARCDVWGIGATLYHLLTGSAPFAEARTFAELHLALNTEDVPWIQDRAPWLDPGLATVVHGALLRDRALRCDSVSSLRTALLPYLDGSTAVNAMMLEPIPAVLRRVRAKRGERVTSWEPSAPSGKLPPVSAPPVDELLGKRLGPYRLLRRLSSGRSGGLYEAIGPDANRCAVRVIPSGGDEVAARRFVREARALSSIDDAHVVRLIDAAYDEALERPYAVLALLYGQDLGELLDKHGAIDPQIAVTLLVELCRGLAAAHEQKIIHRDVNPRNVFLVEEPGGEVCVKLVGFGHVKRMPGAIGEGSYDVTLGGDLIGSPMYMAPEQAKNATRVDARSDVYSAGATLFHALAGAPPFPEDLSAQDLIVEVAKARPRPLVELAPWLDPALVAIVERAMSADPTERFDGAADLLDALEPHGRGTKIMLKELGPIASEKKRVAAPRPAAPSDPVSAADASGAIAIPIATTVAMDPVEPPPSTEVRPQAPSNRVTWLTLAAVLLVAAAAVIGWLAGGP